MSVVGLMDSRIDVYRIDIDPDNPTNSLGEPGRDEASAPAVFETSIRASLQMPRLRSYDEGPGDRSSGVVQLFYEKRSQLQLGDIVHVKKGPMAETWWQVDGIPFAPSRTSHKEVPMKQYNGQRP